MFCWLKKLKILSQNNSYREEIKNIYYKIDLIGKL